MDDPDAYCLDLSQNVHQINNNLEYLYQPFQKRGTVLVVDLLTGFWRGSAKLDFRSLTRKQQSAKYDHLLRSNETFNG